MTSGGRGAEKRGLLLSSHFRAHDCRRILPNCEHFLFAFVQAAVELLEYNQSNTITHTQTQTDTQILKHSQIHSRKQHLDIIGVPITGTLVMFSFVDDQFRPQNIVDGFTRRSGHNYLQLLVNLAGCQMTSINSSLIISKTYSTISLVFFPAIVVLKLAGWVKLLPSTSYCLEPKMEPRWPLGK